jgi:hypothetical protein
MPRAASPPYGKYAAVTQHLTIILFRYEQRQTLLEAKKRNIYILVHYQMAVKGYYYYMAVYGLYN